MTCYWSWLKIHNFSFSVFRIQNLCTCLKSVESADMTTSPELSSRHSRNTTGWLRIMFYHLRPGTLCLWRPRHAGTYCIYQVIQFAETYAMLKIKNVLLYFQSKLYHLWNIKIFGVINIRYCIGKFVHSSVCKRFLQRFKRFSLLPNVFSSSAIYISVVFSDKL